MTKKIFELEDKIIEVEYDDEDNIVSESIFYDENKKLESLAFYHDKLGRLRVIPDEEQHKGKGTKTDIKSKGDADRNAKIKSE